MRAGCSCKGLEVGRIVIVRPSRQYDPVADTGGEGRLRTQAGHGCAQNGCRHAKAGYVKEVPPCNGPALVAVQLFHEFLFGYVFIIVGHVIIPFLLVLRGLGVIQNERGTGVP